MWAGFYVTFKFHSGKAFDGDLWQKNQYNKGI